MRRIRGRRHRGRLLTPQYGAGSLATLFATLAEYRLGDIAAAVTTPMLVTDRERRSADQSQRLSDALGGPKALAPPGREPILDWLDAHLGQGPRSFGAPGRGIGERLAG